ncbi:lysozyme inhibitor LprI family protein [Paraburkholderia sp. BCC1886]|uniref:lysozyme inhibitor LprI family protein n=1 Tax=Paraburkholderia sp. BCC1886 TaxID=2562670 RepID=UPI001182BEF9|nr:hypothetical protein [Paraburkholderia sp. BCC1886]
MNIVRPLLIAALVLAQPAHATSFDCGKAHSPTEQLICNDPTLSKLDDALGQLYWKVRRRVSDSQSGGPGQRRAFLNDSDRKWAWREANCRDLKCLGTWYATRIEELKQLIQTGPVEPAKTATLLAPVAPVDSTASPAPASRHKGAVLAAARLETASLQCTATQPGIVMNAPCATVIKDQSSRWRSAPHSGDWFCGVAMLAPEQTDARADSEQ